MKKLILLAVMAVAALTASAQIEPGFRLGARADLGMSNVTGFDGDKFTFSYGVNFVTEYNFNENLYIGTGLGLNNYAHKEDGIKGAINAYYLTLPIHVGYRFNLSDSTKFFLQAGPQLAFGLFGSDIDFGDGDKINYFDKHCAKRFDLGIGTRIGVEFSKVQISAGFNYGLLKVVDAGGHNVAFNVGIGYMF